jgi:Family of unknown function (DUF5681)
VTDDTADFKVGYKKPPTESQFKKGRSGNPSGRPKGSKNFVTSFHEISREPILVTEGGRSVTRSKFDVILLRMVNDAISGSAPARRDFFQAIRLFQQDEVPDATASESSDRDAELMKNFMTRMQKMRTEEPT